MRPPPPHGAQSAPWGPRRNGATSAERGPHRASCARWGAIPGVFERGATQPDGMERRPNAVGLSPRAANVPGFYLRDFMPWFARRRRDAEIDEEIESHLQMAIRDRIERGEPA